MIKEQGCFKVLTLSGAMTIAKMGLVASEMVERGWVDAIVSTGALMCHGFVETSGFSHFKYNPSMNDTELFEKGYNRVYDTLELEDNLDSIEQIVRKILLEEKVELKRRGGAMCASSAAFTKALGQWLVDELPSSERALLKVCCEKNVPVFIPAFTDSELALDYEVFCRINGALTFDPFLDLEHFANLSCNSDSLGIFTIGGGVPRNWAQQIAPFFDIMNKRVPGSKYKELRFKYGVRICPEPVHWGGLSGCTYSEGVSWGKFIPRSEGGRFAEVYSDATIAWPIVVKAVMERLDKVAF
jgi:deoxyhypusine synthase